MPCLLLTLATKIVSCFLALHPSCYSCNAAELDAQAAQPAEADSELEAKQAEEAKPGSKAKANSNLAISSRGHTNRGRVRQKSHKSAELVEVGSLR